MGDSTDGVLVADSTLEMVMDEIGFSEDKLSLFKVFLVRPQHPNGVDGTIKICTVDPLIELVDFTAIIPVLEFAPTMHDKHSAIAVTFLVFVYVGSEGEVPCVALELKLIDLVDDPLATSIQLIDAVQFGLNIKEGSALVARLLILKNDVHHHGLTPTLL